MNISIGDGTYLVGLWFTGNEDVDWMMTVYRKKGEKNFRGEYRFRYHVDDKNFDSDDVKHWTDIDFKDNSEEDIVMKTHLIANELGVQMGQKTEFVSVRSDDPEVFFNALKDKPWAHIKKLEPGSEEAKKYMEGSE